MQRLGTYTFRNLSYFAIAGTMTNFNHKVFQMEEHRITNLRNKQEAQLNTIYK